MIGYHGGGTYMLQAGVYDGRVDYITDDIMLGQIFYDAPEIGAVTLSIGASIHLDISTKRWDLPSPLELLALEAE